MRGQSNDSLKELAEALVGDTSDWTQEELVEKALVLVDRSAMLTRIEDVLHEAFSDEAKHVGAEYLNVIAEIAGVISR